MKNSPRLQAILLCVALAFAACTLSCKTRKVDPIKMNPSLQFSLQIPDTFHLSKLNEFPMILHVKNIGKHNVDAEPSSFQLWIDGERSFVWGLTIGNRKRSMQWFELPPGETMEEDLSQIVPTLFTKAGDYALQLKWKEQSIPAFTVHVME